MKRPTRPALTGVVALALTLVVFSVPNNVRIGNAQNVTSGGGGISVGLSTPSDEVTSVGPAPPSERGGRICRCDWMPAASMSVGRIDAAATRLADGRVLVVGGYSWPNTLASAELYDPGANTWTSAGVMSVPRQLPTATLLRNGKVLVAGGFSAEGYTQSSQFPPAAELYDPATNTWSSGGMMLEGRWLTTATLLPSGRVLVAGGDSYFGAALDVELYDPATNTWSQAAKLLPSVDEATATLLPNGRVLVAGGGIGGVGSVDTAELYDEGTDTWSPAANMLTGRRLHTATLLKDGRVLVAGGLHDNPSGDRPILASAELYDPTTDAWSLAASMRAARIFHTATLRRDGSVLVAGGEGCIEPLPPTLACTLYAVNPENPAITTLDAAELYYPEQDLWLAATPMSQTRARHTATMVRNGRVLVVGGMDANLHISPTAESFGRSGPTRPSD